jgi:type I restriction-modification system DNA methylase subunit
LNTGYKGKQYDVFAYNGGLFKPDKILDSITIDDDLLYTHTLKLSEYDFASEVDVNILGHIFENSLNELDEIKAQLEGAEIDKSKTKRKKDGVFYTPKYITKYIVENTVGKLCAEKKIALEIIEEEYFTDKKRQKKTIKGLIDKLEVYRKWLLQLTICDPACGSGAFLNQALDFLIDEHSYIDELQAKLFGDAMVLSDVEKSILENNLFGVDLNEESVEIAKLSLWLRTAQPNRKLNDLNNNIKCGNSLIDDIAIAGDKAFNWQNEFPQIFEKGGFDVIIGNPPYVNANDLKKNSTSLEYNFLKANYSTAKGTVDLYIYFFEKGLNLLNFNGILTYITPNRFLSASYGSALREYIIFNYKLEAVIDYSDKNVFPDASTYPVITTITQKTDKPFNILTGKFDDNSKQLISSSFPSNKLNLLDDYILGFLLNDKLDITEKIIGKSISLSNTGKINATSTAKEADDYSVLINEIEGYKLINTGTIDPYFTSWGFDFLTDKGKKYKNPYLPYNNNLISKNRQNLYSSPKIIISKIGLKCEAFYDGLGIYASVNTNCIHSFENDFKPEYILCWINSKLYNYMFECLFDGLRMSGGYLLFSAPNLKNTHILKATVLEQSNFIGFANNISDCKNMLQEQSQKFQRTIQRKFELEILPKKLQDWYLLSYPEFIKELAKKKVKLSLSQEAEWEDYFIEESKKALDLKSQIDTTDKAIDKMVYELYGLTEEEIEIVEKS